MRTFRGRLQDYFLVQPALAFQGVAREVVKNKVPPKALLRHSNQGLCFNRNVCKGPLTTYIYKIILPILINFIYNTVHIFYFE